MKSKFGNSEQMTAGCSSFAQGISAQHAIDWKTQVSAFQLGRDLNLQISCGPDQWILIAL